MKRIALIILCVLFPLLLVAFPSPVNGCYMIDESEDLNNQFIKLEKGSTVLFRQGGFLQNGFLVGEECRIVRTTTDPVFDQVQLNGTWCGSLSDDAFAYREKEDHYRIIASLFRFNEVVFSRKEYWIGIWYPILVNGVSQVVHGNGVTFFITSDKGEVVSGKWGPYYKKEMLFSTPYVEGGNLDYRYEDIMIEDNAETRLNAGWGEDVRRFRIYSYFSVLGRKVCFNNVHSDGGGALQKVYNFRNEMDELCLSGCRVRTSQFAVEVLNVRKDTHGHSRKIVVKDCDFYQYGSQKFVGLFSVVGPVPTDSLVISTSRFDGTEKAGNLEVTHALNIEISGCLFINQFLQSEPESEIRKYDVHDNRFQFVQHKGPHGYSIGGRDIRFVNNVVEFHGERTQIRLFGCGIRFEDAGNRYYVRKGRRKLETGAPFIPAAPSMLPNGLKSFLLPLFYQL